MEIRKTQASHNHIVHKPRKKLLYGTHHRICCSQQDFHAFLVKKSRQSIVDIKLSYTTLKYAGPATERQEVGDPQGKEPSHKTPRHRPPRLLKLLLNDATHQLTGNIMLPGRSTKHVLCMHIISCSRRTLRARNMSGEWPSRCPIAGWPCFALGVVIWHEK